MIKSILVAVLMACAIAGCATTAGTQPTPAQVAAQVCPPIQAALTVLSVPGAVDPSVEANLMIAKPIVATVCNGATFAAVADLHDLAEKAIPALLAIVESDPDISADDKKNAVLGVAVAQAVLAPVLAQAAPVVAFPTAPKTVP